jgi:GAF domain-containing protein
MGLRPIRVDNRTESSWLRVCIVTAAVAVAAGLAFVSGLAISRQGPDVPAGTVAIAGLLVASIVVAQFVVQLFALIWAGKAHHVARLGKAELAARNDQLWLINRLCSLLERENGRRSVAGRVIEFCFEEFDVTSVVYWGTNSYGAPQGPELSRNGTSPPQVKLPDTQRAVLARNAARDGVAMVIDESGQARTLDPAGPPVGAFALFMPLRGDDITEGVLEVNGTPPAVRFGRWQVVPVLAGHVGAALQRGRAYEQLQERAEEDYLTGLFQPRLHAGLSGESDSRRGRKRSTAGVAVPGREQLQVIQRHARAWCRGQGAADCCGRASAHDRGRRSGRPLRR